MNATDRRDRDAEWAAHCDAHPNPPAGPIPDFVHEFAAEQAGMTMDEYRAWLDCAYGVCELADCERCNERRRQVRAAAAAMVAS